MLKAYKYRLYPTREQQQKIDHSINVCRLVYNLALQTKIWAWQAGVKLSSFDLCYQLPELKESYPWMKEVDSQALQASIKKIDISFKNFFRGNGYPKFKNKKDIRQSFQCPNGLRIVDPKNYILSIPKISNIPIVLSRQFNGKIKTVTIIKTKTRKYFASILVESEENIIPKPKTLSLSKIIGLDVGIKSFVVSSDGRVFEPNRKLKESLKRLQVLQRRSSKKVKGSKNRQKANLKVALLHEKITNKRLDYIHKITNTLTNDNQVDSIVIENLNVSGLLHNHKLAQAISDVSFGELFRQLEYKCKWRGKNLIRIDRFEPSSKCCSNCKELNHNLTLADREWTCEFCGAVHDRDLNAAKNVRLAGIVKYIKTRRDTSGEPVERSAMKGRKEAGKIFM